VFADKRKALLVRALSAGDEDEQKIHLVSVLNVAVATCSVN
jgi:hypothetical protein